MAIYYLRAFGSIIRLLFFLNDYYMLPTTRIKRDKNNSKTLIHPTSSKKTTEVKTLTAANVFKQ